MASVPLTPLSVVDQQLVESFLASFGHLLDTQWQLALRTTNFTSTQRFEMIDQQLLPTLDTSNSFRATHLYQYRTHLRMQEFQQQMYTQQQAPPQQQSSIPPSQALYPVLPQTGPPVYPQSLTAQQPLMSQQYPPGMVAGQSGELFYIAPQQQSQQLPQQSQQPPPQQQQPPPAQHASPQSAAAVKLPRCTLQTCTGDQAHRDSTRHACRYDKECRFKARGELQHMARFYHTGDDEAPVTTQTSISSQPQPQRACPDGPGCMLTDAVHRSKFSHSAPAGTAAVDAIPAPSAPPAVQVAGAPPGSVEYQGRRECPYGGACEEKNLDHYDLFVHVCTDEKCHKGPLHEKLFTHTKRSLMDRFKSLLS